MGVLSKNGETRRRSRILTVDSRMQNGWIRYRNVFPQKSTYHITQSASRTVQNNFHTAQRRLCETQASDHLTTPAFFDTHYCWLSKRRKTGNESFLWV